MILNGSTRRRTLFRHPLAAVGGALALAGGFLFIILLLFDLASHSDNPYRSLVTFVVAPAVVVIGVVLFVIAIAIQVRAAHRKGEKVRFNFYIDPTDPGYLRNLWLFLGLSAILILLVAYSGYRAYEATDSVAFCGETCHTVMEPQAVTYRNSPHAKVPCVECHIGPGASFYVRSKFDGIRQVWRTMLNSYHRPIETPVRNLRPAQQTCEGCHWPRQFYGEKLVERTYYKTDEQNSPWTINLLVKIGGGNPRTGKLEGIHWHMLAANKVEYIATDAKRQVIPWVRVTHQDGTVSIYTDPDVPAPDPNDPKVEVRRFDCMDCHNRPSHRFLAPAMALNLALSTRNISPTLPSVRQVGLDLLNAKYETREEAQDKISKGLMAYYQQNNPDVATSRAADIDQATKTLESIYHDNFFPEMKTDYRARENNLSHFVDNGCFRCHDKKKQNEKGEKIAYDCKTCHLIVAQGPSEHVSELNQNITGLDFQHPEDIGDAWKESNCTECHTPDSGY
ncbi:MAG TPA: NapC/NirT family cytochrome c [Candidatus Acidoferrum sp.]|nr:NapC/NirT family cytochrome c [Candidatus Acidoferrum sp.]